MPPIYLLDDSLSVEVFFEDQDCKFDDCICVHIFESCPPDEKVFKADEIDLYITPEQARQLGEMLLAAAESSQET